MQTTWFDHQRLHENLERIRQRIAEAAERAGRSAEEVRLIAVTKTVDAAVAQALVELGVRDLAENRPQELWRKAELVRGDVHWHQIGHLQRNKVKRTLPLVALIHSVDSVRLAREIDKHAALLGRKIPVLLEVNASREPQKHGFPPDELDAAVDAIAQLPWLDVRGLMTMAALVENPELTRPTFRELAGLRERLRHLAPAHWHPHELSMGMSNDFEVAVEEGATMVRIGSALFEGIHRR